MSITLDVRGEIPLHHLDLTAEPVDDPDPHNCVGIYQAADSSQQRSSINIGDMILGVLFLHNTYTVMAYGIHDANGNSVNDSDLGSANSAIHTRLALLGITDPKSVMQTFHVVCVSTSLCHLPTDRW